MLIPLAPPPTQPDVHASPLPIIDQLRQRVTHVPLTLALIASNLVIFVLMLSQGAGLWHTSNTVQLAWGANYGPATKDGEWWRLGSALFLHFGVFHLAMNMVSLWDGGRLVERMYGATRFALIYFGSGLCGNLLSLIAQGDLAVSGGASGAIFGVYGASLVFLWRERDHLDPSEFKWLFWGAAGFSVVSILLGMQVTGIDNAAHVGGLLGGILTGTALARPTVGGSSRVRGRWLAAGALVAGLVVLIASIPAPRYRWSEEMLARGEISEYLYEDARISAVWGNLISRARMEHASFDELAGSIESEVSKPYDASFNQLMKLQLSSAAPSAETLASLRSYAVIRRDASKSLVEGLRARDLARIQEALDMASHGRRPTTTRERNTERGGKQ